MPIRTMLITIALSFAGAAMSATTYPQPGYVSFSPTSGPPGTVITFNGSGYTGLNAAWIGAAHNAAVHVVSDSVLKITVPAGATTAHVGLLNPQRSMFTSQNFTVTKAATTTPQPLPPPSTTAAAIAGAVTGPANASVQLTGTSIRFARADADGKYNFAGVANGVYTLAPDNTGHVFTPSSFAAKVNGASVTGVNFVGVPTASPTYAITGTVSGSAWSGVEMTLNGANVGSAATDLGGNYGFFGLASGTYTVSATLNGHAFSPAKTITVGNVDSVSNNFTSTATPADNAMRITALSPLPQATVGKAYSQSVLKSISGGRGTYHYQSGAFTTGTPPAGMILNANGTLTGTPKKAGKSSFTVCAADSFGDVTATCADTSIDVVTAPVPSAPTPPPTTNPPAPPAAGTSWVYYNGVFNWPGDYSFAASVNYSDTSGGPMSGPHDIKVTTGAWGGWLPYALNWNFNSAPYTKLTFALKPTIANQKWHVYFVKVGDIPVGVSVDASNYGPAPVAGQWATYTVPLADLGVLGTAIYKFCIQDQSGLSSNSWYVDNVGFVP